jgi:hypothetical protein
MRGLRRASVTMRRVALALAVTLTAVGAAEAANSKAQGLARDADRLYRDNKYRDAAETLKRAYELEPTPLYLYNIARAFDQAGELELSLDFYRRYVGSPSEQTQPELLKKANLSMDRLRTLVAKSEAEAKLRDAEKKRLEDETRKAEARAEAEAQEARRQRLAFEAKEKARKDAANAVVNGRKVAAFVAGGVGVAGLGTALGVALAANGNREAFRKAQTLADKQRLEMATRTTAAVTDVSVLVGIAGALAAVILFPREPAPEKPVSVVLAPIAGGAVAGFGGTF